MFRFLFVLQTIQINNLIYLFPQFYLTESLHEKSLKRKTLTKHPTNQVAISVISREDRIPENEASPAKLPKKVETVLGRTKKIFFKYSRGLLLAAVFNESVKILVAEPRPCFIQLCNPDLSSGICFRQNVSR